MQNAMSLEYVATGWSPASATGRSASHASPAFFATTARIAKIIVHALIAIPPKTGICAIGTVAQ